MHPGAGGEPAVGAGVEAQGVPAQVDPHVAHALVRDVADHDALAADGVVGGRGVVGCPTAHQSGQSCASGGEHRSCDEPDDDRSGRRRAELVGDRAAEPEGRDERPDHLGGEPVATESVEGATERTTQHVSRQERHHDHGQADDAQDQEQTHSRFVSPAGARG